MRSRSLASQVVILLGQQSEQCLRPLLPEKRPQRAQAEHRALMFAPEKYANGAFLGASVMAERGHALEKRLWALNRWSPSIKHMYPPGHFSKEQPLFQPW